MSSTRRVIRFPRIWVRAAGPYLVVYMDSEDGDVIDNVLYASEAREEQWRFESALRERFGQDEELASLHEGLRGAYARMPQAMTHFGVAYQSGEAVKETMARLSSIPELEGRVTLSDVYEPGGPGSVTIGWSRDSSTRMWSPWDSSVRVSRSSCR